VAGGVVGSNALINPIRMMRNTIGTITDPHSAWMLLRSLETLELRMSRAGENAAKVCAFFHDHPKWRASAIWGFLQDGRQADIYRRHCTGAGSTFSLYLKGGEREAFAFLDALKIAKLAVSLGGTETLASAPAAMTHLSVPDERKKALGISDNLVRISIGVEDPDDLIADFDQAHSEGLVRIQCRLLPVPTSQLRPSHPRSGRALAATVRRTSDGPRRPTHDRIEADVHGVPLQPLALEPGLDHGQLAVAVAIVAFDPGDDAAVRIEPGLGRDDIVEAEPLRDRGGIEAIGGRRHDEAPPRRPIRIDAGSRARKYIGLRLVIGEALNHGFQALWRQRSADHQSVHEFLEPAPADEAKGESECGEDDCRQQKQPPRGECETGVEQERRVGRPSGDRPVHVVNGKRRLHSPAICERGSREAMRKPQV
jgi:hypothetical protein